MWFYFVLPTLLLLFSSIMIDISCIEFSTFKMFKTKEHVVVVIVFFPCLLYPRQINVFAVCNCLLTLGLCDSRYLCIKKQICIQEGG